MSFRSLLFVPGDRPERMPKALLAGPDALILDLEDSVAPQRKAQARTEVAAFLKRAARPAALLVRINSLQSGLADEDLDAIADGRPDAVVLPKAEGAESILDLVRRMNARGLAAARILPLVTETPAAIFRMGEYSTVAERLLGVTWGAEDLTAAVGAASARDANGAFTGPYEMVRALTLFAAHAARVPAIETVYPAFRDQEGLSRFAYRGYRDGFTGMLAIHPLQVPLINAAFTPSAEAVDRARRIIAEFEQHPGAGVVTVDGAMVDAPHLAHARRILERVRGGR